MQMPIKLIFSYPETRHRNMANPQKRPPPPKWPTFIRSQVQHDQRTIFRAKNTAIVQEFFANQQKSLQKFFRFSTFDIT